MPTKPTVRAKPKRTNSEMTATTKAKIIAVTISLIAKTGYAGTTTSAIAARSRVSRAALVYHFQTKDLLMVEVIIAIYETLTRLFSANIDPAATAKSRVLSILERSYQFTSTDSQIAFIELVLAAKRDRAFGKLAGATIAAQDAVFNQQWQQLTAGFRNQKSFDSLRDFAVSTLRGIAIARSLGEPEAKFHEQYLRLKKLFLDIT